MAEPVTAGTEVPHDAGHTKAFPPLDPANVSPQLIWLALTFVVLYALLSRVVLPRIGEVIEERKDRIKRDLAAAERLKAETEKALASYEKALADARANASGIARQTRDSLNSEVDKERKAVEDQLARKLADAEASIAATKAKALGGVKDIAGDTVMAIVSALTGGSIAKDEADRAVAASGTNK